MAIYSFLVVAFLLALNAFFAGAEVALLSVRQSRLKEMAVEGVAGARTALQLLDRPERLLSVVQVGVTLASLGLGWAGEGTLSAMFSAVFGEPATELGKSVMSGVSFALGFLLMSYAHVVVGEVVPKNLAIEKADRLAVIVAPALLVFCRVSLPFVLIIEYSAKLVSRALGLRAEPLGGGHSPEELKLIISASRLQGHLGPFEEDTIQRMLGMQNRSVREIMVPRNAVVSAPLDAPLNDLLRIAAENQYSRIPIYDKDPEQIVGILYVKDLLSVWHERRLAGDRRRPVGPFQLQDLMRKPVLLLPETKPVNQLIEVFRKRQKHMAAVVDEFGTITGVVTLEDALEQIFGEIEDEHVSARPHGLRGARILELEGSINILDLKKHYGIDLPADAGFETLAGFILERLGHIPEKDESIEHEGRRFTVVEMDLNRISRVLVEKLDRAAES